MGHRALIVLAIYDVTCMSLTATFPERNRLHLFAVSKGTRNLACKRTIQWW